MLLRGFQKGSYLRLGNEGQGVISQLEKMMGERRLQQAVVAKGARSNTELHPGE